MGLGNRKQSFLSRNLVLGNALGPASLGHLAWVLGTLSPEPGPLAWGIAEGMCSGIQVLVKSCAPGRFKARRRQLLYRIGMPKQG